MSSQKHILSLSFPFLPLPRMRQNLPGRRRSPLPCTRWSVGQRCSPRPSGARGWARPHTAALSYARWCLSIPRVMRSSPAGNVAELAQAWWSPWHTAELARGPCAHRQSSPAVALTRSRELVGEAHPRLLTAVLARDRSRRSSPTAPRGGAFSWTHARRSSSTLVDLACGPPQQRLPTATGPGEQR